MDNNTLLKNACRAGVGRSCAHYILANQHCDGALKAHKHDELCRFYVSVVLGCDPDDARQRRRGGSEIIYQRIHDHTSNLTSYMDTEIGFKIGERNDLDVLEPAFFEKFHALALEAALSAM